MDTLATLRKRMPALTNKEIAEVRDFSAIEAEGGEARDKEVVALAEMLPGRDRSTIYRELRRNSTHPDGLYRPFRAQER
jgi:IS30 family transposase